MPATLVSRTRPQADSEESCTTRAALKLQRKMQVYEVSSYYISIPQSALGTSDAAKTDWEPPATHLELWATEPLEPPSPRGRPEDFISDTTNHIVRSLFDYVQTAVEDNWDEIEVRLVPPPLEEWPLKVQLVPTGEDPSRIIVDPE